MNSALARAHRETQRRLLEQERAAIVRLNGVARAAVGSSRASPLALHAGASRLAHVLAPAIAALRAGARGAGLSSLADEAEAAGGLGLVEPALQHLAAHAVPSLADRIAGQRAATPVAAFWLVQAEADGPRSATSATVRRLGAIAGAETGAAFGSEREAAFALMTPVPAEAEAPSLPLIGRVWDARLDACPLCRDLDGTLRPVGFPFPGGWVPGARHRRCRCISGLIVLPIGWQSEAA